MPKHVDKFLAAFLSGFLQTVINERYNHKVRDLEVRANASKYATCMSMWFSLLNADLIDHYGRDVIRPPHSEAPMPGDLNAKSVFEPSPAAMEKVNVSDLNGPTQWQTWTSMSIKRAYHEQELMVLAHKKADRSMVTKSWRTNLLPSGEVVLFRGAGIETRAFPVLWNVGGVCGAWPVSRHENHVEVCLKNEVVLPRS